MRQQLREAVKRMLTGHLVEETGGEYTGKWPHPQTTSNCCMWKLSYFCGQDSPIKWNWSRWLIK